jgi:hypothetical protein
VIHNVGVGYREPRRIETEDGLPLVFAVNVIAPYVLTALIEKPARLVYLSSGMHRRASAHVEDLTWRKRRWDGAQAYAESKLHDVLLAFAVARRWPSVLSNALEPGWVPTRMGGPGAPDDMDLAHRTQVWLATSDDPGARVTGQYFYHMRPLAPNPAVQDNVLQDQLLEAIGRVAPGLMVGCGANRPGSVSALGSRSSPQKYSPTPSNLQPSFVHQYTASVAPVSPGFHSCPGVHMTPRRLAGAGDFSLWVAR